ncbi:MAG: hypothetical protein ABL885_12130, partial [Methylophilaceae bacterium]
MSKFHQKEHYLSTETEYKLLPFKFDRLNDSEYVLTNDAVEKPHSKPPVYSAENFLKCAFSSIPSPFF